MNNKKLSLLIFLLLYSCSLFAQTADKYRIAVVDSYHESYRWSIGTQDGFANGLLDFGFLDNREQIKFFNENHHVESSRAVITRYWMDSKHKNSQVEIAEILASISASLEKFQPDIIFLGDDNASNYFGNAYLDTETPVVFWGINASPLKYGLLDSVEQPGHNVTGIYQKSYHKEGIEHLLKLVPGIRRIALISDDSPTGRSHSKSFHTSIREGLIDIEAVKIVRTNSYSNWQKEILELSTKVDAFLISTHATMKDDSGNTVSTEDAARWYLENVSLPEAVTSIVFVKEGMLSAINDSPFKQGYEAVRLGNEILVNGKDPATLAAYAPEHGGFMVNSWRAEKLGLTDRVKENLHIIKELVDVNVVEQP